MHSDTAFQLLFDTALEIDKDRLHEELRGGGVIIDDRDLSLLQHQNRVALALGPVTHLGHRPGEISVSCYDVPLLCVLHAGAGCHFRSAKLVVDLSATTGALVRDMAPRDVSGDNPVEVTTTVTAGLTFDVVPSVAGAEVKRERSTTRKLYHPRILTSGKGFARAFWDFRSIPGEPLQSDRELRLLVSMPLGGPLLARFNLLAQVSLDGAARIVPLLRRRAEIDQAYRLA